MGHLFEGAALITRFSRVLNNLRLYKDFIVTKDNIMAKPFFCIALGIVLAFGTGLNAMGETFPVPEGPVILTISGDIGVLNVENTLVFDRKNLLALPATTFETSTIWTQGVRSFTGVTLHTLADLLGLQNGHFFASAINDYSVEIPLSDAVEGGPIIAYSIDDKEMSLRDKGPLWVIYPYDSNSDFRSEVVYLRSIWQLDRLEAVEQR
jgi:hypothetical protein